MVLNTFTATIQASLTLSPITDVPNSKAPNDLLVNVLQKHGTDEEHG